MSRTRHVVLLVDVNGSLAKHSDVLPRSVHAAVGPDRTEVFTIGSRPGEPAREFLNRWGRAGWRAVRSSSCSRAAGKRGDPEPLGQPAAGVAAAVRGADAPAAAGAGPVRGADRA